MKYTEETKKEFYKKRDELLAKIQERKVKIKNNKNHIFENIYYENLKQELI